MTDEPALGGGPGNGRKPGLAAAAARAAPGMLRPGLGGPANEGFQGGDGAEALRVLSAHASRCNIILLDLMMPVMNGWDFRRKQREIVDLARIPVLLMSAGAHMDAASGDMDVVGFMTKPVEVDDLLAKVKKHCV